MNAQDRVTAVGNIGECRVRTVEVPLAPVVETAAGKVTIAPLVLVDIETTSGAVGRAYVFTYTKLALGPTAALVERIADLLRGVELAPASNTRDAAARFALLGRQGLVGLALSAIDMALWDAHARAFGVPLYRLLGANGTESIAAYASLRGASAAQIGDEAAEAKARGFKAAKVKLNPASDEDAVLRAVRDGMGEDVALMVDYNQCLTVPEAIARCRRLADQRLTWIEEPVGADDFAGHAAISERSETPIQVGENYWGAGDFAKSIRANASRYLMPDLMKVGGVSGWMQAAALAAAAGVPISSHLFVEFSSQVLAATPGRHYLEWLDIASPILARGTPHLSNGTVRPCDGPGAGIMWDEDSVRRYAA